MTVTLLKQDLQSSIDKIAKAESHLTINIEELTINYFTSIKDKFPSLQYISIEVSNDYSEEYDAYMGAYISGCRLGINPVELSNPDTYIEKTEGKDFYTNSSSFPLMQWFLFSAYTENYTLLNEDFKQALIEINMLIGHPIFSKAYSSHLEMENFQLVYNFDTKSMTSLFP